MWNFIVLLLLCLFVMGYLETIRTDADPLIDSSNDFNRKMCDVMNNEADPCDDFYRFACGKYTDEVRPGMHDDSTRLDTEKKNMKEALGDILRYVNHDSVRNSSFESFKINLAIDLFKSCMNKEKQALGPILRLMQIYKWPVIHSDYLDLWDSLDITKGILNEGFDMAPILSMQYIPASESATEAFLLGLPTFVRNKTQLLMNQLKYQDFMVEIAMELGAERTNAKIDMQNMLAFEVELMNKYDQPKVFDSITIDEMESRFPNVKRFIQPFLEQYLERNRDMQINLLPLNYFNKLEIILENTKDRTIANYLMFRAVLAAAEYLTIEFDARVNVGLSEVTLGHLFNKEELIYTREDECLYQVDKLLPMALDSLYMDKPLQLINKKKDVATKIVENIKSEFIEMVRNSIWISKKLKNNIIGRLESMQLYIADPDYEEELKFLFDSHFTIDPNDFLSNYLKIKSNQQVYSLRRARISSWEVKLEYIPNRNKIYIPYGALNWPLFSSSASSYFNYGGLGSAVGNLFAEALDTEMQKLLRGSSDEAHYNSIKLCFKRLYSEMESITGIKITDSNSIYGDMADNLGVNVAYNAHLKLQEPNVQLPKPLNYTPRQLFWISMAQSHCESTDPLLDFRFNTSELNCSQSSNRIMGKIKNMPAFAKDFNCSETSKMAYDYQLKCEYL